MFHLPIYLILRYTMKKGVTKVMKIAIIMDDGFEELEAMGPIDILIRGGLDLDIVGICGTNVTGRSGVTFSNAIPFEGYDFTDVDCLIVPGGPHYQKLEKNEKVMALIKEFATHKIIAAICAAPTLLGHQGLLKGKKYTCFTSMNEDFGGTYIDTYAVVDGNIITGKSAAACVDFGFAILETLKGKALADKIKESVYYASAD